MNIFIIIVFGLATVRTITRLGKNETNDSVEIIGQLLVCLVTCVAYYYLLKLLIKQTLHS